jgi:mannose-6-phosphate isomerase-like protein (cupin superfamily)
VPIKVIDLKEMASRPDARRTTLINGPSFNAFFHIYLEPGQKDEMHCHNADGTFFVIEGECTMHFPDGGAEVLKPGMCGLITGGSFYQLHNSGDGPMVLLGHHGRPSQEMKTILHETRKELVRPGQENGRGEAPKFTQILV